jgi:hypothetical protein
MARLVFVHGRGQGESSMELQRAVWLEALNRGIAAAQRSPLDSAVDVRVPFYGKILDDLVASLPIPGKGTPMGVGGPVNQFEGEFILELAARAGISDEEIAAETHEEAVPAAPENWPWVLAAGRVLSRHVPGLGDLVLGRLVSDVHAYLTFSTVAQAVNKCVSAELDATPAVIVGHSLGSVVAYAVLTELGSAVTVPLFVTVGSPLGINVVKKNLPHPLGKPPGVVTWFNAADKRDPVALFPHLGRNVFPADIENLDDLKNPADNPHGIGGYLADPRVAARITDALDG